VTIGFNERIERVLHVMTAASLGLMTVQSR
jgi:hypothetical protein